MSDATVPASLPADASSADPNVPAPADPDSNVPADPDPAVPEPADPRANALREAGFIARAQGTRWVLSYDRSLATLGDPVQAIGTALALDEGWPPPVTPAVQDLRTAHVPLTDLTLAEVLGRTAQSLPRVVAGGGGSGACTAAGVRIRADVAHQGCVGWDGPEAAIASNARAMLQ